MTSRILVFPAGMPRSLTFAERAKEEGQWIIGSSSLKFDPTRKLYHNWTYLPYISSDDFDEALRAAIQEHQIDGIYTPNPVVWNYLNKKIQDISTGVALINPSPVSSETAPYQKAIRFAENFLESPLNLSSPLEPMAAISALEIAALFHHADAIPGMCDIDKIFALCSLFRYCPKGDVVEIGSWWGKSAFVLSRLSICYGIGKLLCVDPWSNFDLIQNDNKGLVDSVPVDAEEALRIFQINLLPYGQNRLNYLRHTSVEGAKIYRECTEITTDTFGSTKYVGKIAILHIDGNHSYDAVKSDIEAWAGLVIPGGWIIIDDYTWPYGDGPKRAGDELLAINWPNISCSFFMGGALFIQLSGAAC